MKFVLPSAASLPFDCHNHVQLGILRSHGPLTPPLSKEGPMHWINTEITNGLSCSGMAIMSTHPRDYPWIAHLSRNSTKTPITVVSCFGIHPWFIEELEPSDWEMHAMGLPERPQWWWDLRQRLIDHPQAVVGELGLDRFHYTTIMNVDGTTTQQLSTPMEKQIQVFEYQMELAIQLERPVSIHCVHAFGILLDSLRKLKQTHQRLPPKIYFHAFSGQLGTIPQILALCESSKRRNPEEEEEIRCYFGLAPVVNFRSPKTPAIVQALGLYRLVLETDVEEMEQVASHLQSGISFVAEALGVESAIVLQETTRNAMRLYNLLSKDDD